MCIKVQQNKQRFLVPFFCLVLFSCFGNAQSTGRTDSVVRAGENQPDSLDGALLALSTEVTNQLIRKNGTSVAVVDFVGLDGSSSPLGRYLADEMVTLLFKSRRLKLVDRQQLRKVIQERQTGLAAALSSVKSNSTVQGIGLELINIIGERFDVRAVAISTIADLGTELRVNTRLVQTKNGEIISAASAAIPKKGSVCALIDCSTDANSAGLESSASEISLQIVGSPRTTKRQKVSEILSTKSNFFTFNLKGCRSSGSSVLCEFSMTNDDVDRDVWLSLSRTKIFDDIGNEYQAKEISFGGFRKKVSSVYGRFIGGLTIDGRLRFDNFNASATQISLLVVSASEDRREFVIQFRNVTIAHE